MKSLFKDDKNAPLPFYKQTHGAAYVGDALYLIKTVRDGCINLIITSPPFALARKKDYGNESPDKYIEWFLPFASEFKRVLADDGSFVVDFGGAYLPGNPVKSIYQFELLVRLCKDTGFFLAQDFYHYNPSRLPAPAEWVNVRRIRVKDSVNVVWWLSKTENPKADNRKVLRPYSESMKLLFKNGYKAKLRPSGHDISGNFSKVNAGAIPPNLLEIANTESNSIYLRRCKEANVKPHPARFHSDFADFFIRFLTDEGDVVMDPFSGSNTTGYAAEILKRKWISFEIKEEYVAGSLFRFEHPGDLFSARTTFGG